MNVRAISEMSLRVRLNLSDLLYHVCCAEAVAHTYTYFTLQDSDDVASTCTAAGSDSTDEDFLYEVSVVQAEATP